ncbi:MAG: hypothetical protein LBJ64_04350 [Deltaproteobacteria bacterium]|nr:hypothetical protein [Deltaproteobacteria bacterium]
MANGVGSIIFEKDRQEADQIWNERRLGRLKFPPAKDKKNGVFYVEAEGATLRVRKDETEAKTDNYSGKGAPEKSVCLENQLGVVYNSDDFLYWPDDKGERRQNIGKREYVCHLGAADEFTKYLFAVALRRGYGQYQKTIFLSDGSAWTKKVKDELFPDAQEILDFSHLSEHVSKFAESAFSSDKNSAQTWADHMRQLLKDSQSKEVLKEIAKLGLKRGQKSKVDLAGYIRDNEEMIDYKRYEQKGWRIGGDSVESAHKSALQQILKQAGMIWKKETGQFMLSLMAKDKSNMWNSHVVPAVREHYRVGRIFENLGDPFGLYR